MKYFNLSDFDSPDKKGSGENMNPIFLDMLDRLADYVPIKINSGYRTPEHNKKIGGTKDSSHIKGLAVDISCVNSRDRYDLLAILPSLGFNRIGVGKTFIHIDIDTDKDKEVIWTY